MHNNKIEFRIFKNSWVVIFAYVVLEVGLLFYMLAYYNTKLAYIAPIWIYKYWFYLLYAMSPFLIISLYMDKKWLSKNTGWRPTYLYMIMAVPVVFNIIIAVYYLYRRKSAVS